MSGYYLPDPSGIRGNPSGLRRAVQSYQQHTKATPIQGARPNGQPGRMGPAVSGLGGSVAPGAPGAPGLTGQPLPFDPVYQQTLTNNQQGLTNTLGGIQQEQNQALTGAGYIQNGDQFTLDPSNPFSRASLLQRHYDQSVAGSTNGLAARGQLYSGALQNAQNQNRFQFDQGSNANLSDLQSQLVGLAQRRSAAASGAAQSNTDALGTSLDRAQAQANSNRDFNAQQLAYAAQAPGAPSQAPALTPKAGYTHINTDPTSARYKQSYNVKGNVHTYANGGKVTVK